MENNTFTVTGFISYLKRLVDGDFNIQNIYLKGEISKVSVSPNGHCYFDLKDSSSTVSCVCFKNSYLKSKEHIKTGNKVICFGSTTVYTATSRLQFNVLECKASGVGDLYEQFELLKKKLAQKGLFDHSHKKECPEYPLKIAVVVGKDSAAYTDIVATFNRRWPIAKVDYFFSLVQGKDAHLNIISNLLHIDDLGYDAIILARGGGSIEDLWCFNEEALAEVIYDLNTFIVTGVGHEIDTTIVDYVSDLRANTPTAAVELITPDINDLKEDLAYTYEYMHKLLLNKVNKLKHELLKHQNVFSSFDLVINRHKEHLDKSEIRLNNSISRIVSESKNTLNYQNERITSLLGYKCDGTLRNLQYLSSNLKLQFNKHLDHNQKTLKRLDILLDAFSPLNVMKRGFVIASSNGQIIKRIDKINVEDTLDLTFNDGSIKVLVKEKRNA